jgi:hypothetical protein
MHYYFILFAQDNQEKNANFTLYTKTNRYYQFDIVNILTNTPNGKDTFNKYNQ